MVVNNGGNGGSFNSRREMVRQRHDVANKYGAAFLEAAQRREATAQRQLAHRAYDRAIEARAQSALRRKTSPKQFAPSNDPFKQKNGTVIRKQKVAAKVTKGSRSVVDRAAAQNLDRVGKQNRKNLWTTDIIHFSKPQRTDPRTFRYEKTNKQDLRMAAPMYSSFTRDGVFREPNYTVTRKVKPRKMVAPRLSDYQATVGSPQAVVMAATTAPEMRINIPEDTQLEATVVVEREQMALPQQRVRKARPVSAPPGRVQPQRIQMLQSGTIMDALDTRRQQRRPFSSQPNRPYRGSPLHAGHTPFTSVRPVSAKAVRSSGFQNITMEEMKVSSDVDDEDFEEVVLSRPGSPVDNHHTASFSSLASSLSRPISAARTPRKFQASLSRQSSRPASPLKRVASRAGSPHGFKSNDEDRFWSDDEEMDDLNSYEGSFDEKTLEELIEEEEESLKRAPPQPGRVPPKVDRTAPVVRVQLKIV